MNSLNLQLSSAHQSLLSGSSLSPKAVFKVPTRPDLGSLETPRPDSAQSFAATSFNRPASMSTTLSAPTPPSSVSTISPLYDMTKPQLLLHPIQFQEGV
jgi:hypothetical protein